MKDRRLLILLLLVPIALAVYFWEFSTGLLLDNAPASGNTEISGDLSPHMIVEGTEVVQFDDSGEPAHWLRSIELVSPDADQELIHMSNPTVSLDPDDESRWNATSAQGIYNQSANLLRMTGDVILVRETDEESPITMYAETLDYFPDEGYAESAMPVTIETLGHKIESTGISIDLDNSVFKLKSKVRSQHDPI